MTYFKSYLPDFIKKTGIMEMRAALQEKEVEKKYSNPNGSGDFDRR